MKHVAFVCVAVVLLLVVAFPAGAQKEMKGLYSNFETSTETTDLGDGRTMQVGHFREVETFDDPFFGTLRGDCIGVTILAQDGSTISASGSCFFRDGEGNGFSAWWRHDEVGTADCPVACGSSDFFAGYGKLEGVHGGGTFEDKVAFTDPSMVVGESRISYSLE